MSDAKASPNPDVLQTVVGHLDPEALAKATRRAVTRALAEDLGERGDLTSRATVPASISGEAELVAREPGVISGLAAVVETFAAVDPRIQVEVHVADGDRVITDQVIAVVSGPMRALLTGERTALNFLGHLSGIATATARLQDLIEETGCHIRDTRKTTPGLRLLEKAAVLDGGGANHRIGLFDAILVKENHILAAGDVVQAVENLRRTNPGVPVQVEVEEVEQIWRLLDLGVTDILLDNFTVEQVRQAASRVDGRARLEVSGNLDASSVREYAQAVGPGGRLAVGAITHSAPALDVAMDVVEQERVEPARTSPTASAPAVDPVFPVAAAAPTTPSFELDPPSEPEPEPVSEAADDAFAPFVPEPLDAPEPPHDPEPFNDPEPLHDAEAFTDEADVIGEPEAEPLDAEPLDAASIAEDVVDEPATHAEPPVLPPTPPLFGSAPRGADESRADDDDGSSRSGRSDEELDEAEAQGAPFSWRQSPFRQRRQRGD